jgi:hypothetical protein
MDVIAFREAWGALRSASLSLEPGSWLLHIQDEHPLQKEISAETLSHWIQQEIKESETIFVLRTRSLIAAWLPETPASTYQELLEIQWDNVRGCVWTTIVDPIEIQQQLLGNPQLETIAMVRQAVLQSPHLPMRLQQLRIPKPWGYEGWYTGVEQRGVTCFADEQGATELPYALNLFPESLLAHQESPLILLKTLNPVPKVILGDLYLELHKEKWEVYIVIAIDERAWPDGVGQVRAGLHPELLQTYQQQHGDGWWPAYQKDFRGAIQNYETLRRQLDEHLDQERSRLGYGLNQALSPEEMQELLSTIPEHLQQEEAKLRLAAEAYVGSCPVRVGDVVSFPTWQMHSLQHGVRVIEFQTPHYERMIVMFGQKVLTQDHWNTEEALAGMKPEVYYPPQPELIWQQDGACCERVVDFPDFDAFRLHVPAGQRIRLEGKGNYQLLIGVEGYGQLLVYGEGCGTIRQEDGWMIPAVTDECWLESRGSGDLICLQAIPKND